tara:strand:+ start:172 stop:387 length:216 start_codon:yes stop_codon:yes gene_type:complete
MMVREEVIRPYDGKIVVWERRNMPELVKDSKRIMKKDYYDPHFWVMVEVRDDGTNSTDSTNSTNSNTTKEK